MASCVQMPVLTAAHAMPPLSLAESLNAMLLGWLERTAERRQPGRGDLRATAAVTVADNALGEIERVCEEWALSVGRPAARGSLVLVEGPARVVEGFTEIVALLRR